MDKNFSILEQRFRGKVNFLRMNWESREAESAKRQFDLDSAPASVLADSRGNVAEKMESAKSIDEMDAALKRVLPKR